MGIFRRLPSIFTAATSLLLVLSAYSADAATKDILTCQKKVNKAAQAHLKSLLNAKAKCVESLVSCKLEEEAGGDTFAACSTNAVVKCEKKINKAIEKKAPKISATLVDKCQLTESHRTSRFAGLGFRNLTSFCENLSPAESIYGKAELGSCVQNAVTCRTDDILEELMPRAYEVLDEANLLATLDADSVRCLDVRAPSPSGPGDPVDDLLSCQKALRANGAKTAKIQQKRLLTCMDSLLRCEFIDERPDNSVGSDQMGCLADADAKCDTMFGKISTQLTKRQTKIDDKCSAVSDVTDFAALGFGITCPAATDSTDIRDCATAGADEGLAAAVGSMVPRTCQVLGDEGRLTGYEASCIPFCGNGVLEDGESCDDGNRDPLDTCTNSCVAGPTDFTTVIIPSSAAPANTPDGTAGTAVAPGSTLAAQFGSTIFDLNNATYNRYFVPGAGDPDAVLILIPGFAGGAQSLKYVAENLVVRADTDGSIVLEVWLYDRRTDQLEDDAGLILAVSEADPVLALDWLFGSELGFTLDPRLSRRAGFHSTADIAFTANWTSNVLIHDIDAVVDAASALPGSPEVYLGGHSFGTTLTARYAATDLDPGAGVTAGYSKLTGLVLFEGGGASLPASPPTDDDLDLIIAKADGGLYNAVISGAASCVDGTPCPGGDVDCAAVTLPPGALTNKCVDPTELFPGATVSAFTTITPEIHAAGDALAIQGRLDPDAQVIVQQDFSGPDSSAVDLVPGLGILTQLPDGSAEMGLGAFLDDEFSPVAAFRASLGYSTNGSNVSIPLFPGVLIPAAATLPEPYRVWIPAQEEQPTIAVPDNGSPGFDPNRENGQEVEATFMETMFALLRSGENNFGDWYFPSAGLSTTGTSVFSSGLDSTPLSVTRGRPDIENLTEAAGINIPIIALGGTNGLTPTPGSFKGFAESIGTCTAPTCTGTTARVITPLNVQTVYGDVDGGYEVHLSEGYAHLDVVTAEDDPAHNNVYDPLMAFLLRNTTP